MKLPGKVRIGPHDIAILEMDPTDARVNYGCYSSEEHAIRLRSRFANKRQWAETLIHEIEHGIWDAQSIHAKDGEERIVRKSAMGWSGVIRDNPDLILQLVAALK